MYLFSVIVPIYNVEKYLDECVQSLIHQTYTNIDIILVDDGSTDSSGIIADKYARMDCRIQIIHKSNGGLSSARNEGLLKAKGDYILFVDSDDYISSDYFELIEQQLHVKSFDMIITGSVGFIDYSKPKIKKSPHWNIVMTAEETLETAYYQELFDINACAKVIKSEIARKHPFLEGILYEDFENVYKLISECKSVLYIDIPKYFYRRRRNSITNSPFREQNLIMIDIAKENLEFIKINYPNITRAAVRRYVHSNLYILGKIIGLKEMSKISQKLRKNILIYRKDIIENSRVRIKEKISVCILIFGLKPYKMFRDLIYIFHEVLKYIIR